METLIGKTIGLFLIYLLWRAIGWWALAVPIVGTGVVFALTL